MAAYVVGSITVKDPEKYAEYSRQVPELISRWGGRFLVRGGKVEQGDGRWEPERLVVIEFPDLETARNWYESPEYQEILRIRLEASEGGIVFVEGYGPD